MRFRPTEPSEPIDINLIPLIDVLLVMLIFLAATTTFSREQALKITLPSAQAETTSGKPIELAISTDGRFAIGQRVFESNDQVGLEQALKDLASQANDPVVMILADAMASHQSVIDAMQASRRAGIGKIQFATRAGE